jgi:hypothetical protein
MRIVAGLLCMLLVAGCSEKDKIPSGVIGKEEMEKILWDMMLADQYSANYLIKDSAKVNVKIETLKLYEEVFRLHKVTRDAFRKSYEFYQGRPDITRTMLDSLVARGNRARSENYTRPPGQGAQTAPTPPKPMDTIKSRMIITPGSRRPMMPPGKMVMPPGKLGMPQNKPGMPPAWLGDTSRFHRPPAGSPNLLSPGASHLPPGAHPFLRGGMARPLRAGEAHFKPMKRDSVTKGRQ